MSLLSTPSWGLSVRGLSEFSSLFCSLLCVPSQPFQLVWASISDTNLCRYFRLRDKKCFWSSRFITLPWTKSSCLIFSWSALLSKALLLLSRMSFPLTQFPLGCASGRAGWSAFTHWLMANSNGVHTHTHTHSPSITDVRLTSLECLMPVALQRPSGWHLPWWRMMFNRANERGRCRFITLVWEDDLQPELRTGGNGQTKNEPNSAGAVPLSEELVSRQFPGEANKHQIQATLASAPSCPWEYSSRFWMLRGDSCCSKAAITANSSLSGIHVGAALHWDRLRQISSMTLEDWIWWTHKASGYSSPSFSSSTCLFSPSICFLGCQMEIKKRWRFAKRGNLLLNRQNPWPAAALALKCLHHLQILERCSLVFTWSPDGLENSVYTSFVFLLF